MALAPADSTKTSVLSMNKCSSVCQVCPHNITDQEAALQFHQRAFGRQLLRSFAQPRTTPEFARRLRRVIEQPVIDGFSLAGEPPIEIEAGHVPLVLQAAPGQSRDKVGQIVGRKEARLTSDDLAVVELLLKM
jgi:hypothetical protein